MTKLFGENFIADELFRQEHTAHIIKVTDSRLDWSKIKFDKLNWDLEVNGLPYQIVRAYYHVDGIDNSVYMIGYPLCHCIGGRYGNNNYYAYPLFKPRTSEDEEANRYFFEDIGPTKENLIKFSGQAPHWGIVSEGAHYFRKSEIRDGGKTYITRNNRIFYPVTNGSIEYGLSKAQSVLTSLQDHPLNFADRDWKNDLLNRKIWYNNSPAVVTSIIEDQGCVIIKPDPNFGIPLKPSTWMIEDNGNAMIGYLDDDSAKCEYLYEKINWFRTRKQTERYIEIYNSTGSDILKKIKELRDENRLSEEDFIEIQKIMFMRS